MILIADAGSSKTDWALINDAGATHNFTSTGLNPYAQSEETLCHTLQDEVLAPHSSLLAPHSPLLLYYYGAGCTGEGLNRMRQALEATFAQAALSKQHIALHTDLLGAARALYSPKDEGLAVILGTGSGACHYAHGGIVASTPSLGYILGDEGSGAVLGLRLLGNVFKHQLPDEICALFLSETRLTVTDAIEQVYHSPNPRRFLASFTHFLSDHIDLPPIAAFVEEEMERFATRNLLPLLTKNKTTASVAAVGSLARVFQPQIQRAFARHGLMLTHTLPRPIEGLVKYHSLRLRAEGLALYPFSLKP